MCRCDRHLNLRPAPRADVVCVLILHSNVKRNAAQVERSVKCLNVSIVVSAAIGMVTGEGGDWAESKQTVGTDTGLSVIVRARAQSAQSAQSVSRRRRRFGFVCFIILMKSAWECVALVAQALKACNGATPTTSSAALHASLRESE